MKVLAIIIAGAIVAVAGFLWANRPLLVVIPASPASDFPRDSFSHTGFERLLESWVDEHGNVDYEGWHGDAMALADLDTYLAAVSAWSPDSHPARFATRQDALAYWMYAYNAYVIRGVLSNWPITSVTDVKAPIEAVKGLGFFYRHRYLFGGKAISLYHVENDRIREGFRDPRIHFVLNCASGSCPVVRPELPTGSELEALLDNSAVEFINDSRNVLIDDADRAIYLSPIFGMYEDDYLNWLRAVGRPAGNGLIDYVAVYANSELGTSLDRARDYDLRFREFDWSLNTAAE